jgi:hypothetical protein
MEKLSEECIRHVLGYFGDVDNGWEAGSFHYNIMRAFQCADPGNFLKLEVGFPDYAWAMRTVLRDEHGMDLLRAMAGLTSERMRD